MLDDGQHVIESPNGVVQHVDVGPSTQPRIGVPLASPLRKRFASLVRQPPHDFLRRGQALHRIDVEHFPFSVTHSSLPSPWLQRSAAPESVWLTKHKNTPLSHFIERAAWPGCARASTASRVATQG